MTALAEQETVAEYGLNFRSWPEADVASAESLNVRWRVRAGQHVDLTTIKSSC